MSVLRKETEWIELVINVLQSWFDADPIRIKEEFIHFSELIDNIDYPAFYGDGKAAEFILREVLLMCEK